MNTISQLHWTSASRSHVGLVRELNEDSFLELPERGIWAVADGMGGHSFGDYASQTVVNGLAELKPADNLAASLRDARLRIQMANKSLRSEAAARDTHIIGSTVVVLMASERQCGYLWAGDSRIYLYRNGKLRQLTRDHSQLEELKMRGGLSEEDAAMHPLRNMITRAVGAADVLDIDQESVEVSDGDMFLLCSDGLSNAVSETDICGAMAPGDCAQASDMLIALALDGGGRDNITVVVVRASGEGETIEMTSLNPAL
ncbi:PP2C family protein-serine/threonine phosphatase [Noviherbaspirillum aerium]|uniref:PP2C family protein-serine/threonine phosphatase n=1 Tax=Noviherbaspirillum aerium TaxID=2588497 RepID=UPI00124CCAA7|nr:protein phosphatase 2C domain-containing protein [Noviherbaspirillum aerium]